MVLHPGYTSGELWGSQGAQCSGLSLTSYIRITGGGTLALMLKKKKKKIPVWSQCTVKVKNFKKVDRGPMILQAIRSLPVTVKIR